jgi:hypothetical protein
MVDYRGNEPYIYYKEYKVKYKKGYRGSSQKTIGMKPAKGNSKHNNGGSPSKKQQNGSGNKEQQKGNKGNSQDHNGGKKSNGNGKGKK